MHETETLGQRDAPGAIGQHDSLADPRVAERRHRDIERRADLADRGRGGGIGSEQELVIVPRRRRRKPRVEHIGAHREQRVLQMRFGLENGKYYTLSEIGEALGVTRERIRQIEAKALRKLRQPQRSRKLKAYTE